MSSTRLQAAGPVHRIRREVGRSSEERRPRRATPIELEAGRIDQIDRIAQRPAQMPVGVMDHQRKQLGENFSGAVRIGIRQRRALHRARAQMVQPPPMALQTGDDLAQTRRPGQLAIEQRDELAFRRQSANPRICPVLRHQPVKLAPRQMLQNSMKNAILMAHGIDPPISCPDRRRNVPNRVESMPCPLSTKTQPDSRGLDPGIHAPQAVDCRVEPGNDDFPRSAP